MDINVTLTTTERDALLRAARLRAAWIKEEAKHSIRTGHQERIQVLHSAIQKLEGTEQ